MFDYKNILDALFEKVERMRTERPIMAAVAELDPQPGILQPNPPTDSGSGLTKWCGPSRLRFALYSLSAIVFSPSCRKRRRR